MELLFLGTSAGTPTRSRNVTGLGLQVDTGKGWYLIDCGEATQHQLLRTPLSLHDLRAICITHVHGDHCYGLPGLLASAGMQGRKAPLVLIGPQAIEHWLRATLELTQAYLPYELHFIATEAFGTWHDDQVRIDAFPLSHRVPSHAYRFTETKLESRLDKDKLLADGIPRGPLWGRLYKGLDSEYAGRLLRSQDYQVIAGPPRCVVVGGDNDQPELLRQACAPAQVLVHEATYTQAVADKAGPAVGHSAAAWVGAFAESAGLANLVLTHFSARYQNVPTRRPCIDEIRAEAAAHYSGRLFLADDFARLRLNRDALLQRVDNQGLLVPGPALR
ncbi:ribonuclease Z [Pseudomonas sp. LRF_L74]|uniref:ribonuclease Z n=1 Tax=Pseudomonas sp. LRF_L74 TaxID=3369422 RepID=UPI003F60A106